MGRMRRVAIVGVDHMAGGTSGGAVIAGLIVRTQKVEQRIEQARTLQALKHRVGARECAEAAIAQTVIAALEDAQGVTGLGGFELWQRPQLRQHGFDLISSVRTAPARLDFLGCTVWGRSFRRTPSV